MTSWALKGQCVYIYGFVLYFSSYSFVIVVVEQAVTGTEFVPMSADPGIVTDKCQDVMLNQTDNVVVDGLWGHYSDREWYSTIQYM